MNILRHDRTANSLAIFNRLLNSILSSLLIPIAGSGVALLYIAPFCYWTDSEIWAVSSSANLIDRSQEFAFEMKPLFYSFLYVVTLLSKFAGVYFMFVARAAFAANALAICTMTCLITYRLTQRRLFAFIATGLLLTSVEFVEQIYRVRSDFLATTVILALIYYLLRRNRGLSTQSLDVPQGDRRKTIAILTGSVAAIAFTPNAAVLIVAFSPLWLFVYLEERASSNRPCAPMSRYQKLAVAVVAAILAAGAALWMDGLSNSLHYFHESFQQNATGVPYWSYVKFEHLIWFGSKDVPFVTLTVLSLCLLAFKSPSRTNSVRKFGASTFNLAALLVFHPAKMPFMIASYMPFFAILIALMSAEIATQWQLLEVSIRSVACKLGMVLLVVSQERLALRSIWKINLGHNSDEQLKAAKYLDNYLKQFRTVTIYDVIGILPDFPPIGAYIGPGQIEGNQYTADLVNRKQFDFLLDVKKLTLIRPQIADLLERQYIYAGKGVYVRAHVIEKSRLHLDSHDSIDSESFLALAKHAAKIESSNPVPLCLQVVDDHSVDVTTHVLVRNGTRETSLTMRPETLLATAGRVIFPKDFAEVRVTPFGCPQLPTTEGLEELFLFDAAL